MSLLWCSMARARKTGENNELTKRSVTGPSEPTAANLVPPKTPVMPKKSSLTLNACLQGRTPLKTAKGKLYFVMHGNDRFSLYKPIKRSLLKKQIYNIKQIGRDLKMIGYSGCHMPVNIDSKVQNSKHELGNRMLCHWKKYIYFCHWKKYIHYLIFLKRMGLILIYG